MTGLWERDISPVLRHEFQGLVYDSVGHRDAERGAARLHLVFPSLDQRFVFSLAALLLLFLRWDKPWKTPRREKVKGLNGLKTGKISPILK